MKRKNYSFNRLIVGSFFMLSSSFLFGQTPDVNGIVYVKPASSGDGSGDSWLNATDNLQGAIDASGTTNVFVTVGTYPATTASFIMKNNVAIYGGFDPENGVDDLSDNRILLNLGMGSGSVLDGLNARPLIWNDNNGLDNSAILDGFTLTNGYSNNNGGAIFNVNVAPYFNHLVINNSNAHNGGGAVYNSSSPIALTNSVIVSNTAAYGGGIMNFNSNVVIENVELNDNTATMTTTGAGGGAIFNQGSDMKLTNALIYNNTTGFQGGAFVNLSGKPVLTNVTIANNTAAIDFSGIEVRADSVTINNSILFGTNSGVVSAKHSLIEGNSDTANGNLDATGVTLNDVFADASNDDYTLSATSPVINSGNNTLFSDVSSLTVDLAGNVRVYNSAIGGIIDLGAYELQGVVSIPVVKNSSMAVYPNPVNDKLFIESDEAMEIEITDALGNVLVSAKFNNKQNVIDVSNFAPGVYFIKSADSASNETSNKFVKY